MRIGRHSPRSWSLAAGLGERLPAARFVQSMAAHRLLRLPAWLVVGIALAAGVPILAMTTGQAVGPVLSGNVTGTSPVTVSQAITLDTNIAYGKNPGFGNQNDFLGETNQPTDGVSTRNEDGTAFSIASEVSTGQKYAINIYLRNTSNAPTGATLELNIPRGIDVDLADIDRPAEGGSNVSAIGGAITVNLVREARMNATTWLLSIGAEAGRDGDDGVTLIVRPKADVTPGFYVITGRLTQIRG